MWLAPQALAAATIRNRSSYCLRAKPPPAVTVSGTPHTQTPAIRIRGPVAAPWRSTAGWPTADWTTTGRAPVLVEGGLGAGVVDPAGAWGVRATVAAAPSPEPLTALT